MLTQRLTETKLNNFKGNLITNMVRGHNVALNKNTVGSNVHNTWHVKAENTKVPTVAKHMVLRLCSAMCAALLCNVCSPLGPVFFGALVSSACLCNSSGSACLLFYMCSLLFLTHVYIIDQMVHVLVGRF